MMEAVSRMDVLVSALDHAADFNKALKVNDAGQIKVAETPSKKPVQFNHGAVFRAVSQTAAHEHLNADTILAFRSALKSRTAEGQRFYDDITRAYEGAKYLERVGLWWGDKDVTPNRLISGPSSLEAREQEEAPHRRVHFGGVETRVFNQDDPIGIEMHQIGADIRDDMTRN